MHHGNADEIIQEENRRNTIQMEDNPMLAALRAKRTTQTTSHTVMNAVYCDKDLVGSEQASGDYATINEVPTAEGATNDAAATVTSPERSVVGFTNELYDATPTSSTVDDGLYDTPPPGVNNGGGGGGGDYDVAAHQQQSLSGDSGVISAEYSALTPRNTDADVYTADDGLYDSPSPGSNNDEYLTVTA